MLDKPKELYEQTRLLGKGPGEDIARQAAAEIVSAGTGLICDIGAGEGRFSLLLSNRTVIDFDLSLALLKLGRELNSDPVKPAVVGRLSQIPFRKGRFPWLVVLSVLENYPKTTVIIFLSNVLELLIPGGKLVASFRGGASLRMRYREIRAGKKSIQFRFNARKWLTTLNGEFQGYVIPLLPKPHGWRKLIGTPADARALLIVERLI